MTKISCQICLDLIPLVKDNIASEDSSIAVMKHMESCEYCKQLYGELSSIELEMNDKRVISKIKKQLYLAALITMVFGTILGMVLTESINMFYNILIMPTIGLIGYFALRKKSYYVPLALFGFIYIWLLIKYIVEGIFSSSPFMSAILMPGYWALIYSSLCCLGIVIGFFLKIAFRKEG